MTEIECPKCARWIRKDQVVSWHRSHCPLATPCTPNLGTAWPSPPDDEDDDDEVILEPVLSGGEQS